ncbi:hypothetical protein AB1Y20_021947 [Prymnesium parvum]|uniref:Uncharacterized protein n=1 Tax=Prymnesium parvum TaxID=97485 RepID=A0AB34JHX9_PRYPA
MHCGGTPTAAVVLAGQPRTLLEPLARRSFLAALRSFGARAFLFAYLTADDGGSSKGHRPLREPNRSRVLEALAELAPTRLYYGAFANPLLTPPAGCTLSAALLAPYAGARSKPTWRVWWETWAKVERAFLGVIEYEQAHGLRFDWVLRVRPDLWFFGPMPSHCTLEDAISTPTGVVGCAPPCLNDHIAWMPRALAPAYFRVTESLTACRGDSFSRLLRKAAPGAAQADFPRYLHYHLRARGVPLAATPLLVPYTLLRPCDAPEGRIYADCRRLLLPPQAGVPARFASTAGVANTERSTFTDANHSTTHGWENPSHIATRLKLLHDRCIKRWSLESESEFSAFNGCCVTGKKRRSACGSS